MTRWHWPPLVFKERSLQQLLLIDSIVRKTDAYSFGNTAYRGFLSEAAYLYRHLAGRSRDDAARRGPVIRGGRLLPKPRPQPCGCRSHQPETTHVSRIRHPHVREDHDVRIYKET